MSTRGLRNNNPGNIRQTDTAWQGESKEDKDKAFEEFESMAYGYRALIKNVQGYISKGVNTIDKIITKWAPAEDNNDTKAYISTVEKMVGKSRFEVIKSDDYATLKRMALAISKVENGINGNPLEVDQAIEMLTGKKKSS